MKFHEMTAPEIRGIDKQQTVVVLPIAAVEQHGPHLPTSTDVILCEAVAERACAQLPEKTLLLPTMWLGASSHHLPWSATLTATLPTYITVLTEILQPLLKDGFRRVLLINGHGGNVDPLRVALRHLQPQFPHALLTGGSYWSMAAPQIAEILEGEDKTIGHACEAETSMVMHLRPELVRTDKLENCYGHLPDEVSGVLFARDMAQRTRTGATGRPDLASGEKGERLLAAIADRAAAAIHNTLDEPFPDRQVPKT